ncbi:MAG TPA: enoyl-CoA hydratase/isomerase family protein [Pyrinomonadaceae bacterium]|nr:enoyl-CoA hydratase/isomerase family protein [Pyrinomonadaceae bacterium]
MTETNQPVVYQLDGSVARITLNRPEKKNALSDNLIAALKDSLKRAGGDEAARVVIIKGAGSDFCSGADLSALQKIADSSIADNAADARSLMEVFTLIRDFPIPVVAAVHGRALAGGCGLASACDIVLASASARFGYPEVKIGFVPAMVAAILRRNVSEKRAFELLSLGREISAGDAMEIGLVNRVFPDESFESDIAGYVNEFSNVSRSAVSLTKKLLYQMDGLAFRDALETGADINVIARMTADCQKGIARFLKRV